jgi:hypothetical protein
LNGHVGGGVLGETKVVSEAVAGIGYRRFIGVSSGAVAPPVYVSHLRKGSRNRVERNG